MARRGSSIPFNKRQHITANERDIFLGSDEKISKFKEMMAKPIPTKDRSGNERKAHFVCKQPLQVRIMGELDEVRDITKGILDKFDVSTTKVGLTKLECDKKNRVGNYCKNTIRSYITLGGEGPSCNRYYDN